MPGQQNKEQEKNTGEGKPNSPPLEKLWRVENILKKREQEIHYNLGKKVYNASIQRRRLVPYELLVSNLSTTSLSTCKIQYIFKQQGTNFLFLSSPPPLKLLLLTFFYIPCCNFFNTLNTKIEPKLNLKIEPKLNLDPSKLNTKPRKWTQNLELNPKS